jgi:hypothetical protein
MGTGIVGGAVQSQPEGDRELLILCAAKPRHSRTPAEPNRQEADPRVGHTFRDRASSQASRAEEKSSQTASTNTNALNRRATAVAAMSPSPDGGHTLPLQFAGEDTGATARRHISQSVWPRIFGAVDGGAPEVRTVLRFSMACQMENSSFRSKERPGTASIVSA